MAFGEANDFAEKLLVNLAEDVRGQHGKFVRALRIIKTADNFLENRVIDFETGGEIVRRLDAILLFLKMKEAGVVTLVSFAKELPHACIGMLAIQQRLEPSVDFDPPVFADAQENDAIDGALNGKIQIALRKFRIPRGKITRKIGAPLFDLARNASSTCGGAALRFVRFGKFVEGAFED